MNAKKTGKGMQTVKVLGAVLATLFAMFAAGCAEKVPTSTVPQVSQTAVD